MVLALADPEQDLDNTDAAAVAADVVVAENTPTLSL